MDNKCLFIGPRKNIKNPNITGGVIVLFENLLAYSDTHNLKYTVIDTNKANYQNKLFAYMKILLLLFVKIPKVSHISLHGTANDYLLIAPFALVISKIFNKPFSLRKFAGNFIEVYNTYAFLQKKIIEKLLIYSSCNFFETKYLVDYFKKYNKNTYWFPNVREKSTVRTTKSFNKKFIFLGAISKEKGIEVLCEASNLLPTDYQIDLYGALYDGFIETYFDEHNVTYKGKVNSEKVFEILSQYDVLVLPSLREGYPGVIIEALSVGLPIIATKLQGICEMIDSNSSILIEIENVNDLKEAIQSFDKENYAKQSTVALMQFENFNCEFQTKKYFETIEKI